MHVGTSQDGKSAKESRRKMNQKIGWDLKVFAKKMNKKGRLKPFWVNVHFLQGYALG